MLDESELDARRRLRSQLHDIDAQIRSHQDALHALYLARGQVLQLLQSITYPVVELPFEITARIFLECLPADEESSSLSPDTAPLVFTRVCRNWRDVALNTSALWLRLRVELDSDDTPGYIDEKWVDLIDLWLERAQGQPLSLTAHNQSYNDPAECLLPLLDAYIPQCRQLSLTLPFAYFSRLAEHPSLPLLERLTLAAHGSPDIIHPIAAFEHAPALRSVALEAGMRASEVALPYTQLTAIALFGASSDDALELLALTGGGALTACTLDVPTTSPPHTLVAPPPLASLRTLTLSGRATWDVQLLRYILAPGLQTLDLSRAALQPPSIQQLAAFLGLTGTRAQPQAGPCLLAELRIHVRASITPHVLAVLRLLPALQTLTLFVSEPDVARQVFRAFGPGSGAAAGEDMHIGFLPNVERVCLWCFGEERAQVDYMFQSMARALRGRLEALGGNSRLASLQVLLEGDVSSGKEPFSALEEMGVEVYVGSAAREC